MRFAASGLRIVALALLLEGLAGQPRPAFASTLPYIPLDHWVTPYITEAIGRGLLPRLSHADRPYQRDGVAKALRRAHAAADSTGHTPWSQLSPYDAWLLERIEAEVNPDVPVPPAAFSNATGPWSLGYGIESRTNLLTGEDQKRFGTDNLEEVILPYASFQSGRGLAVGARFRLSSDGELAPDFNGRVWRNGWTGETKNAYVLLQFGAAEIKLGRDDLRWGSSQNSTLLLSDNAPAFDQAGLRIYAGPVTASSFFASLDDMVLAAPTAIAPGDTLPAGTTVQRHISGHRIAVQISRAVQLGVAETVVYGGENRGLEPEYLIPGTIIYAAQWNSGKNDNVMFAATADVRPSRHFDFYGEILVDDMQIDHSSPADAEPFEGGFIAGARVYDPFGLIGTKVRVEWARVNPYTYNQVLPWNRYLYQGQVIGFDLGSDAQSFDSEVEHWLTPQITGTLRFRLSQVGSVRVTDPWPVPLTGPSETNPFPPLDGFPSAVVEQRSTVSGQIWFHPRPGFDLYVGGGYVSVQNVGNVEGEDREEGFVDVSLRLNWSRWFRDGE
jgi:hypothetical protein